MLVRSYALLTMMVAQVCNLELGDFVHTLGDAELLINNNMVSFVGTDCHNMNHVKLYHKCQTLSSWHQLLKSDVLKNNKL